MTIIENVSGNLHNTLTRVHAVEGIIVSGRGVLWEGDASMAVATYYAARAAGRGHLGNLGKRMLGIGEAAVTRFLRKQEAERLKPLYDSLRDSGAGSELQMRRYAMTYLENNWIPDAYVAIRKMANSHNCPPVFLSTIEVSPIAEVVTSHLGLAGFASNKIEYDENKRMKGVTIVMDSGKKKLDETEKMLKELGLSVNMCAFIGQGPQDWELMLEAKVPIAAPQATEEVMRIAKIKILDGWVSFLQSDQKMRA